MNLCDKVSRIKALTGKLDKGFVPDPEHPRVNAYVCDKCGHVEITVDTAPGTTPMVLRCLSKKEGAQPCGGSMVSAYYAVGPDDFEWGEVRYEWYFPTVEEFMHLKKSSTEVVTHIVNGGLMLRRRTLSPVYSHGGFYLSADNVKLSDGECEMIESKRARSQAAIETFNLALRRLRHKRLMEEQTSKAKARRKRR